MPPREDSGSLGATAGTPSCVATAASTAWVEDLQSMGSKKGKRYRWEQRKVLLLALGVVLSLLLGLVTAMHEEAAGLALALIGLYCCF